MTCRSPHSSPTVTLFDLWSGAAFARIPPDRMLSVAPNGADGEEPNRNEGASVASRLNHPDRAVTER